jgi:hypothetical protein
VKTNILSAALLVSSALAVGALAPSAASAFGLKPGNYEIGGTEAVCLVGDGTWYGENFAGWSGNWFAGPTAEDGTLIFGHYASGAGSDTIVVSGRSTADWMDWNIQDGSQKFIDNASIASIRGKCTPPSTKATPGRHNPMD